MFPLFFFQSPRLQLSRVASSSGLSDAAFGEKYMRENEPVIRTDAVKETDTVDLEELPTQGILV